jgi:hypothetical protein
MTPKGKMYDFEIQGSWWPFDCFSAPNLSPGKNLSSVPCQCNEVVLLAERKTGIVL